MRRAAVIAALRTPIGRYGGTLAGVRPDDLAACVIRAVVDRAGIDPAMIDDVYMGAANQAGEDNRNVARMATLLAGLPDSVPGATVNRLCGSGLNAIGDVARAVKTGEIDVGLAGGVESMSRAPFYSSEIRWGVKAPNIQLEDALTRGRITAGGKGYPVAGGMIETAENLRKQYGISRDAQDHLAARSQARAGAAIESGVFAEEITPVTVKGRKGDTIVETDEHPRPSTSVEKLSTLRPIMQRVDPDATVTAGNASGQNDGAAACIVATREAAEKYGLKPMGRMVSWALAGVEPKTMGIGPVPASQKALAQAGLSIADMDLIELNEAFAAQVLACTAEWGFGADDFERMNVHGSGISLGHPVGATGGRILATLAREMDRREARYGLETMCIGGGQGLAAVFERVTD